MLIWVYFINFNIELNEKIIAKSQFLLNILISYISNKINRLFCKRWTITFVKSKMNVTYITNILSYRCSITTTIFSLFMIYKYQVVNQVSIILYIFYLRCLFTNYMSTLLRVGKDIFSNIYIFILTNRKV